MGNPNEYDDDQFLAAGDHMREQGMAADLQRLWEAGAREVDIADEIVNTLRHADEMEELDGFDLEEVKSALRDKL
jgi:hypothetical protein